METESFPLSSDLTVTKKRQFLAAHAGCLVDLIPDAETISDPDFIESIRILSGISPPPEARQNQHGFYRYPISKPKIKSKAKPKRAPVSIDAVEDSMLAWLGGLM